MNDPKAQKLINKLLKEVSGTYKPESVCKQLTELREIALKLEDPLVVKTLRLVREKITEEGEFDVEIEVEDEEEDEFEVPENHLEYLLQLLLDSTNKYNREEIKLYRTALMKELY